MSTGPAAGVAASIFLAELPVAVREGLLGEPGLDALLEHLYTAGRVRWPAIALDREVFLRHLAAHVRDDRPTLASLAAIHAADLFLACACARRDPVATAELERGFVPALAAAVRGVDPAASFVDEVLQVLRVRLLVGDERRPPRIGSYSGWGPLAAWLRIAAVRTAVSLQRAAPPEVPHDDAIELEVAATNPELALLRRQQRVELRAAFREAVESLEPRHRIVLRLYHVDGLKLDQIARLRGVALSTVSRWLADAREHLQRRIRRSLARRLGVPEAEIESLVALTDNQLSVSLSALGAEASPR